LRSIPWGDIEQELAVILSEVHRYHITQVIDPKEVEAYQRKRLGPFFKRILPYHKSVQDLSLVMLGLELGKQAKTRNGETLRDIVEHDIGKLSGHRVVAMVAPSGSGKTATVVDLASKHFVIYCVCSFPGARVSPDFADSNFVKLADDVENMHKSIVGQHGVSRGLLDIDQEMKMLAGERVQREFLARMLFLQHLLNDNPDLEPLQFFREQTNGGATAICELVKRLRDYDRTTIQDMLDEVQNKLRSLLLSRRLGLVIALDEAQVAVRGILCDKLISPSALIKNSDALFDSKNEIQSRFRRGFLTPLSATLSHMQATLVILGTALSLQNADHVYSAIGKPTNFTEITAFPQFDEIEIGKMLSGLIDLSDCEIPSAKRRKLSGRPRFSLGIINHLFTTGPTQGSKPVNVDNAVECTNEYVKSDLRRGARTILESDKTGEAARLLCRMVLAYYLQDAKISFSTQQQSDFVDKALCHLEPHPDGIHLIMGEPLVVEAVGEELRASDKDPAFLEYLDQLNRIITNLGTSSSAKGSALEPLVRRSLQRFNGVHLVDLPFLQGIALPDWCHSLKLQIDDISTANGFGYKGSGVAAADLAFLADCPPKKMLIPCSVTRPDGVWFFSDKRYAGSLAIKFYSDPFPQGLHKENETSSDIRTCFLKKDGVTVNTSLAGIRHDFETSGIPSNVKGILRIHLEFPGVKGLTPVTYVQRDPTTGVEDVMVYINSSNMDTFFDEGIAADKHDMVLLKKLIRFVST
ncbi:hypothetical protein DFQ26_001032, partial [Actinomortierella ambigua]